ncbi:glycosyl hydrolase-related protein [Paenibacillus sp. KQZ6P-2]|uniref:Glycosyl hydrolase-related protein n=1 Tax=Paenibacillus mangrovi TaxID=2931978 RepID=A0A9X1WNY1_9BACL|nr:alpha-mannosidase [Paenibacillus mangrovi]MCJ8012383.1 glycosyl hydrolase-related protein [Paenibacillus mangrovi]
MLEKLTHRLRNKQLTYQEDRVMTQMKYATILSARKEGAFDDLIEEVEKDLVEGYDAQGAITNELISKMEQKLIPLQEEAKQFEMLCVAHAHIDMNWQWGWDETVGITLDTFRTMLQIMREYKDFTFSQSQASLYQIVETYDPEMLEEIKQRVAEGRWEITASTWVEADKNMPSGESQTRQLLYTKKYLSQLFNRPLDSFNIDFEPDTFGHSIQTPEILTKAGVKYYYHCRGRKEGPTLYRWKSPSGAEIIVNWEPQFYNAFIHSDMCLCVPDLADRTHMPSVLKVYGVGDHGGGPTRRDIERIIDVSNWPIYPKVRFSTYREYFEIVEKYKEQLPIEYQEQNFICDGCYSSQSRIKKGNKASENGLYEAELFSTWAALTQGVQYPKQSFEKAWKSVLFNQFHDILTGSGVDATRDYALGLYQEVAATVKANKKIALQKIAQQIHTADLVVSEGETEPGLDYGAGAGSAQYENGTGKNRIYHVFNPTMQARQEVIELMIWEWPYDHERMLFTNEKGEVVTHQVLEKDFNHYWGHNYLKVALEVDVPACGYTTYILTERDIEQVKVSYWHEKRTQNEPCYTLENEKIKVVFNSLDGSIDSMMDKATGKEMIDPARKSGIFRLIDEADHKEITDEGTGMSSWFVGRYKNIQWIHQNLEITSATGTLRSQIAYELSFRNSKLKVIVSLDKGSSHLDFKVECDWQEVGRLGKGVPQLQFYMPLHDSCATYHYDVPFGRVTRQALDIDLPGNNYIYGEGKDGSAGVMLMSKVGYGFRGVDHSLTLTLLRGSYDPDPCPEYGINHLEFGLGVMPSNSPKLLNDYVQKYNHGMTVVTGLRQQGKFNPRHTFAAFESQTSVVSCIKGAEEGDRSFIVRFYEMEGKRDTITLICPEPIKHAYWTDINEQKIACEEELRVEGTTLKMVIQPYQIGTVKIVLE